MGKHTKPHTEEGRANKKAAAEKRRADTLARANEHVRANIAGEEEKFKLSKYGNKNGRGNKLVLDDDLILTLAQMGCTFAEIAAACKCSPDTLKERRADLVREGHAQMKQSLRRAQMQLAIKDKNPTMLIWLGKNNLDQRDNHNVEHTGKDGEALTFNFNLLPVITDVVIDQPKLTDESDDDEEK